jgi:virulence-associated protein VagC
MPGDEVIIHKAGSQLIIEPATTDEEAFFAVLASWRPLKVEFPDGDEGLLPPDDVEI